MGRSDGDVYVIRTDVCDEYFLECWEKMRKELGQQSVYVAYDNTNKTLTKSFVKKYGKSNIVNVSSNKCKEVNPFHQDMCYSVESILARCVKKIYPKRYNHMWLIDNDIFCDGSWKVIMNKINNSSSSTKHADLLGTYTVKKYSPAEKDWPHWNKVMGRLGRSVPVHKRAKCFFPLTRFSRKLLRAVVKEIGHSGGFSEVYIPTLAVANNLKIEDIPSSVIGKFDWRPVAIQHNNDNKLYHQYRTGFVPVGLRTGSAPTKCTCVPINH